jgi:AraC family transcriptional regulator of adaptative response/methylated-DNA-[protein]-cysteine methyltransferase
MKRSECVWYATDRDAGAVGTVLVAWSERGLCAILLGDDAAALREDLERRFRGIELIAVPGESRVAQVLAFLEEPDGRLELPLDPRGTEFQRRVWEALREIPAGATITYGDLAARLGMPSAVRAVAAACGANPLAVVIPCHRVIGRNGKLTGYRWGVDRKAALLARESCVLPL